MSIDFKHDPGLHTVRGATSALRTIFPTMPGSVLDIGCGTGSWLRAALDLGAVDVAGIDGISLPSGLHIPASAIQIRDLTKHVDLGRRYDLVICLETGEHLDKRFAASLIQLVTTHSDTVLFSAACPGQGGTHHVNCQWPDFWQELFNSHGFTCDDACRYLIWDIEDIEPWYRQNIFLATHAPAKAGTEARIRRVIHPDMLESFSHNFFSDHKAQIESGALSLSWYAKAPLAAMRSKLARAIGRKFSSR